MTNAEIEEAVRLAKTVADRYRLHAIVAGSLQDDASQLARCVLALVPVYEAAVSLVQDAHQSLYTNLRAAIASTRTSKEQG